MADPRREKHGPQVRSANHSDLMKALLAASQGEKVNFCPFGCSDQDLDESGHCYHLIGFSLPGDKAFEPLKPPDARGRRTNDGRIQARQPVKKGDKLERITTCSRVYRNIEKPDWAKAAEMNDDELEEATRPEAAVV